MRKFERISKCCLAGNSAWLAMFRRLNTLGGRLARKHLSLQPFSLRCLSDKIQSQDLQIEMSQDLKQLEPKETLKFGASFTGLNFEMLILSCLQSTVPRNPAKQKFPIWLLRSYAVYPLERVQRLASTLDSSLQGRKNHA